MPSPGIPPRALPGLTAGWGPPATCGWSRASSYSPIKCPPDTPGTRVRPLRVRAGLCSLTPPASKHKLLRCVSAPGSGCLAPPDAGLSPRCPAQ